MHRNAVVTNTNIIGKLKYFPVDVQYHPNVIPRILKMTEVDKYLPTTYVRGGVLLSTRLMSLREGSKNTLGGSNICTPTRLITPHMKSEKIHIE